MGVAILSLLLVVSIPPLTEEQEGILVTADDGATRDHREAAFWALLENTAEWTGEVGDAAIRLNPDYAAMLADPDRYRGELCRIEGRIEHIEPLVPPYEGVEAWFVRVQDDTPVLVYVDFKNREETRFTFRTGMRATIMARFYKRFERIADGPDGDQKMHVYAAFVGAHPQPFVPEEGTSFAAVMVPLIIVLGGAFVLVFILARRGERGRAGGPHAQRIAGDSEAEVSEELPADPVAALAILRDRAENEN